MKAGKLSNDTLEKIILKPLRQKSVKREEVRLMPTVGEDCTALDFGGKLCLLSTDPITGAAENIGRLAVYINTNDIAAGGGEPIGIMLTALLPTSITEDEIKKITDDAATAASELGIAVLGGHTEITDAVTRPILSCTVVGKCDNIVSSGDAKPGDAVIMTKYAALEGTAIIAEDKADKINVSAEVLEKAKTLTSQLSVIKEGKIGVQNGVHAMHDITEGGVLGACREVADCSGTGIEVDCDLIPILPETEEICKAAGINPLRLISSGSMLMTTDNPQKLIAALENKGIKATQIGKITEKGFFYINKGEKHPLDEPEADELYKI